MEVLMNRPLFLWLVVATGCGTSTTPRADKGQKDPSTSKPLVVENKPDHDENQQSLYAPKEANFEVRFPSDPTVKMTPHGSETIHVAGIQRQAVDGLGYVCQWVIKEKLFGSEEAEVAYLKGQQEGALKSSRGNLVSEKEISLNGVPGREFIIEYDDQNVLRCRVYLAGKRVVNLQVWGKDKEAVSSKDAVKFF